MDIPLIVTEKAKGLIELYGHQLAYIGNYENQEVYIFQFPEKTETGFPFVYLYDKSSDSAIEVTGLDALEVISNV